HPGKLLGPTRTPGVRVHAIAFTDKTTYFDYGDAPDFNVASRAPFTCALWFRADSSAGVLWSQRHRTLDSPLLNLSFNGQGVQAYVRKDRAGFGPAPATLQGKSKVADGEWHHVALTRDGNTLTLY